MHRLNGDGILKIRIVLSLIYKNLIEIAGQSLTRNFGRGKSVILLYGNEDSIIVTAIKQDINERIVVVGLLYVGNFLIKWNRRPHSLV